MKIKASRLILALLILVLVSYPAIAFEGGPEPVQRSDAPLDTPPDAPGPGDNPTGKAPILAADPERVIPDQYIVVLKKGTPETTSRAIQARVIETFAAAIHHRYSVALSGFAATLSSAALDDLAGNPNVAYIEPDQRVFLADVQPDPTWGLDRIDQRDLPLDQAYQYETSGQGVKVYVLDTGIRKTHNEFTGRAYHGFSAINDGNGSDDCNGHGTHVAGIIGGVSYGVAKAATLYAVRVLNCSGIGAISGVISGIDWVTQNHIMPAVANMSLSSSPSTSLDNAVRNSIAAGVTYSVSAGNDNTSACQFSPARVAEALTVGATSSADARASFSNYGVCLDLFAPGVSITSAWHTGNYAANTLSGTSMAAPHVAGAAALYLQNYPYSSPTEVVSAIVDSATSGRLSAIGSGSPNLLLYSLVSPGGPGPTPTPNPIPPPPCSDCDHFTGSLSGAGDYEYEPNDMYYYSNVAGFQRGWLEGPASADFDLYLQKWSWLFGWVVVARSTSFTSSESITYFGGKGYYVWKVDSYRGSGGYDFWLDSP